MQALNQVLDLTWSIGRAEGAWQFMSFNDFWILAIYSSYLLFTFRIYNLHFANVLAL